MEDELSRWIKETVFASYMEECQILNELDFSYGHEYDFEKDFSSSDPSSSRKRKVAEDVDHVSAGKQARKSWNCKDHVKVLTTNTSRKVAFAFWRGFLLQLLTKVVFGNFGY